MTEPPTTHRETLDKPISEEAPKSSDDITPKPEDLSSNVEPSKIEEPKLLLLPDPDMRKQSKPEVKDVKENSKRSKRGGSSSGMGELSALIMERVDNKF